MVYLPTWEKKVFVELGVGCWVMGDGGLVVCCTLYAVRLGYVVHRLIRVNHSICGLLVKSLRLGDGCWVMGVG